MALLRSKWRQVVVLMPERYDIQPDSVNLRLVVQREMRNNHSAVRAERTIVQVYFANYAKVPGGFHRSRSRSIFGTQVQRDGGETEREETEETTRGEK